MQSAPRPASTECSAIQPHTGGHGPPWDPTKEARNLRKHGLDFSFVALVFADPRAVTLFDRIERGEERWHTIGVVGPGCALLAVMHTDPEDGARPRIIGLRAATRRERRRYEEDPA